MHYRAEYENEAALISALFSLIPDAVGERIYADEKKCEYAYRMRQDTGAVICPVRTEEVLHSPENKEENEYDAVQSR